MKWLKLILRFVFAGYFIFSAISKMTSIEAFEIYLFRSTFLSFDPSTIAARLLIGLEFTIAIAFILRFAYSFFWKLSLLFILIASGFLVLQIFSGEDGNCHCLGEFIEMSPAESILKNAILLVMLMLLKDVKSAAFPYIGLVFGMLTITGLSTPFILSPPRIFSANWQSNAEYDNTALQTLISSGDIPSRFVQGKHILSFYSMKCKYCKMSAEMISALVVKANIPRENVNIVFAGYSGNPIDFFEETHSEVFEFARLQSNSFLSVTKGKMPLTLLIEDGKVIGEMNYREIDESEIVTFFNVK